MHGLKFVHNIVSTAVPDGRAGLAGMELGDEIRGGGDFFRQPGDVLGDVGHHMQSELNGFKKSCWL